MFFRSLLLSTLLLLSFSAIAQSHHFMEENDLWLEDQPFKRNSELTQEVFNRIIDIADSIYQPIAKAQNESLTINRRWDDSTVNANCSRFFGYVTVNMYGGLARRDEITPDGFAMVLCHELGHAYGGKPYTSVWQQLSAEGQSDYYGAKECHYKIMEELKLEGVEPLLTGFMEDTCNEKYNKGNKEWCLRGLAAGQSLGHLLSVVKEQPIPDYETPDLTEVPQTLTSYPDTVQCRLDTYLRGVLGQERPRCWFK